MNFDARAQMQSQPYPYDNQIGAIGLGSAQGASVPQTTLPALMGRLREEMSATQKCLAMALDSLRGPQPRPVNAGPAERAPNITDNALALIRMASDITQMASELENRLMAAGPSG